MTKTFEFEIIINGQVEVSGQASNKKDADRELNHYLIMYSQEGKSMKVKKTY